MSNTDPRMSFPEASDEIVYVREVRHGELPDSMSPPPSGAKIFAIHDSNGARLALTDDRGLAFKLARKHDRKPMSVH
jgi:hypothetical protein